MVDINNDRLTIVNFLNRTVSLIRKDYGEPKSIGFFCNPSEGIFTISFNVKSEIDKDKVKSIEFEYKNIDSLFIEGWKRECNNEKSQWRYFEEGGIFESSGAEKLYNINRYLAYILWTIVRSSTREIKLPTTVLLFEFEELNSIALHSNLENFGRAVTKIFRNDIFEDYILERDRYKNPNFISTINPNLDESLKSIIIEKANFYTSLSDEQIEVLNKIILGTIDNIAFNVLRALDENDIDESGILLTVENKDVRDLPMIGNGNLSGEYFDWIDRFSKYGKYQQL